MRQTLLRIRFDSLFSLEPVDGITAVGAGFLLIPWLLFGLWWYYGNIRKQEDLFNNLGAVAFWAVIGFAILFSPFIAPQFAAAAARVPDVTYEPSEFGDGNLVADGDADVKIPWIPIYGYGFMLFCGFVVAGWFASRRAERSGIQPELVWDLALWILVSGVIGARLFYVVQYSKFVFAQCEAPIDYLKAVLNFPDGGLVLYGGVILGSIAYWIFCRRHRVHPLALGDVVVPSIFIGLAFGRMGCFLNGCCYGDPTSLPWGLEFPAGSVPFIQLVNRGYLPPDATATFPLHPTQLYSSFNALVLAFVTSMYFRRRAHVGDVVALALITYPISRIALEALRGDEMSQLGTGLTISQLISLGVVCSGFVLAATLRRGNTTSAHKFSQGMLQAPPKPQ